MKPSKLSSRESLNSAGRFISNGLNLAPKFRRNIHFIFLCIYLLGNYACVKEVPIADRHRREPHEETNVYIAGSGLDVLNSSTLNNQALYWENGKTVVLTDGTNNARALAIAVSHHNVYVAGNISKEVDFIGSSQAVLWINKHLVPLTDVKSSLSSANSVFLYGNDVYVGGQDGTVAKYWKNGRGIALTDGSVYSTVVSIAVEGDNVYAAGNIGNVGGYWKNGHFNLLKGVGGNNAQVSSILIVKHDIYIGGAEVIDEFGNTMATYWKNGIPIPLGVPILNGSFANSIAVSRNDVYACGWQITSDRPEAAFWENGMITGVLRFRDATSIALSNNDVYIVGHEFGFDINQAHLWKNGVTTNLAGLPGAVLTESQANCIFISKTEERDGHEEGHFEGSENIKQ
jgi:hypothetical protein